MKYLCLGFLSIALCACSASDNVKQNPTPKNVQSIVAGTLADTVKTSKVYLDQTDYGSKWIGLAGDQVNSGGGIAYLLISGIGSESVNIGGKPFTSDGVAHPFKLELLTEAPEVSWVDEKGGSFDTELNKVVASAGVKISANQIYELSIRKIAKLSIDPKLYSPTLFETYVTTMYTMNEDKSVTTDRFDKFKTKYGVATSGIIYEIAISQYKKENLEAIVNATGLIKSNGQIYSKNGGTVRVSFVRLFYSEANADLNLLQIAKTALAGVKTSGAVVEKVLQTPDAATTSTEKKLSEAMGKIVTSEEMAKVETKAQAQVEAETAATATATKDQ